MSETTVMTFKLTWRWHRLWHVYILCHDTCTYADFHKALQKYPSREIDDFDDILFQIYQGIGEPKIVLIYEGVAKSLQR